MISSFEIVVFRWLPRPTRATASEIGAAGHMAVEEVRACLALLERRRFVARADKVPCREALTQGLFDLIVIGLRCRCYWRRRCGLVRLASDTRMMVGATGAIPPFVGTGSYGCRVGHGRAGNVGV